MPFWLLKTINSMSVESMETDNIIMVRDLTKRFRNLAAVDKLSLQINAGESFALLGPDGAGKTTTMRLLCGLLSPDSGEIRIKGFDLARQVDQAREHIGYMPQRFSLYENLSVLQNIVFFSDLYGIDKNARQERMNELLEFSRLTPFVNRLAGQLSGGMKQKLALICTVIHRPPVLLLDEPTTGVDPVSRRDFWKILYRLLSEGTTLMVCTPYMDEAERCNRIGLMYNGQIMLINTPDELKRQMTGEVIEIWCDQTYKANTYLRAYDMVKSVRMFGDRLRVLLGSEADVREIRSILVSKGVNVKDINRVQPSMEDTFVSLLRK
jgi:ABC-2 type transport system ATP-binding protein